MSVMAEHMNPESSLHHPYMWPNGIEQKMSLTEQQHLLHKDGRQESGSGSGYYSPSARPESAASSSPPATGSVLVPQPINGAKVFSQSHLGHALQPPHSQHGGGGGASIRKYQCKMCPQISASKSSPNCLTSSSTSEPTLETSPTSAEYQVAPRPSPSCPTCSPTLAVIRLTNLTNASLATSVSLTRLLSWNTSRSTRSPNT